MSKRESPGNGWTSRRSREQCDGRQTVGKLNARNVHAVYWFQNGKVIVMLHVFFPVTHRS